MTSKLSDQTTDSNGDGTTDFAERQNLATEPLHCFTRLVNAPKVKPIRKHMVNV